AIAFAQQGASVAVADADVRGAQEVVRHIASLGGRALMIPLDVTDPASVETMVNTTVSQLGGLDCAFNNAGVPDGSRSLLTSSQENWDRVMAVNLEGVWHCMQA